MSIAFNAALTLFAIALIFSSTADTEVAFEAHISRGQEYLVKATAALKALDRDNDIVSKCEQYVEYLSQSLDRCRKCLRMLSDSRSTNKRLTLAICSAAKEGNYTFFRV